MKIEVVEARYTTVEVDDKFSVLSTESSDFAFDNSNDALFNELKKELAEMGYKFHGDENVDEFEMAIAAVYSANDKGTILEW